jgi:GAF domain-containing protein
MEFEALAETQSEIALPLSIGGRVLGVLDVQSNELHTFDEEEITTLLTLARQTASALQNVRLLESTQVDLESANLLYQTSHRLADANSVNDVFQILAAIIRQAPYISALFTIEDFKLQTLEISSSLRTIQNQNTDITLTKEEIDLVVAVFSRDIISTDAPPDGLPASLVEFAKDIGCRSFTLMPFMSGVHVLGLLMLGAPDHVSLTPASMQPFNSVSEMINSSIEKIEAIDAITEHMTELQSLSAISDAISSETSMKDLFAILHHQITQAMGDINFLIALYDAETQLIEIPYMDDDGDIVSIPSFPLGQGLTSIVIRTQEPLMIIEDTVNRARALGAIVSSGRPAKSWLGVPMQVGGEVVGAIVVQDTEHEHRFQEDDRRLLTTLAGQVAPAVRNARLLAAAQEAAEQDRQLYEITDAIRRATSIEEILETATRELSKILNLDKTTIEISADLSTLENRDNGTEENTP